MFVHKLNNYLIIGQLGATGEDSEMECELSLSSENESEREQETSQMYEPKSKHNSYFQCPDPFTKISDINLRFGRF